MKSERRHNLETNELAIRMQDWIDRLKPYASQIALVIVGLIALAYVASAWGGASVVKEKNAWDEYTLASYSTDPELASMKLLAENEEFASTSVPEWAYLAWANRQVQLASQTYLTDRAGTTKRLESVQKILAHLAEDAANQQVRERAQYGLAQALEMLGKAEDAKKAYGRVKGDLVVLAESRSEELDDSEVLKACEWLATAELPKQVPASTAGTVSGTKPDFEANVPSTVPGTNPLSTTRSMEEILNDALGPANDENRYGEDDADPNQETPVEQAEEADAAASTGDPDADSADGSDADPAAEPVDKSAEQ
jgi:hypothetical protein